MGDSEDQGSPEQAVTFIRDEPAEEDFFQTHGRLAKAIAAAIRSNPDLRVIGLLGRWGSGKSTVIRHLRKELYSESADAPSSVRIFTYDAWLHQSDPVRRSFLESLLTYLIEEKLTLGDTWKDKLLELTGHIERTDVTQTPVLTNDAKWIFVSLLPVPIAIGLLDLDTIKEAWGATITAAGFFSFWIAIILLAIPAAVTIFRYQINKELNAGKGEETPILPLLMNRSVERTKSTTHRSPEPTSIEFGTAFRQIMAEATKAGDRFVFVIDNLDRMAEAEALQIWATVRSFFLKTSENETELQDITMPVVILPVDTHALERMFALSEGESMAKELARSFVNKTFDITFEVSEPVMSDWRAYLERQMQRAFGDLLQNTWVFWARFFFETNLPSSKIKVTPREINKLVNRIGALFVQWRDEGIQFEILAYYAVRGSEAAADILKFITDPANDIERISDDWKLQFAAIHYGVALDKAAQVLIEEPLRDAVSKGDRAAFDELASIPGFGDTFERLTTSPALYNSDNVPSFDLVTNAALLLGSIVRQEAFWWRQSWRNLIDRYFETGGLGTKSKDIPQRISIFFDHLEDVEEKQSFVDGTASEIATILSAEGSDAIIDALRVAAKTLLDFAHREGLSAPIFELGGEPALQVRTLSKLSWDSQVWPRIRTGSEANSIVQLLASTLRSTADYAQVPGVVRIMTSPGGADLFEPAQNPSWDALMVTAAEIVRQQSVPAAIPSTVEVLGLLLRDNDASKATIEALLSEGHLQTQLSAAASDADFQCSLIALFLWNERNFSPPSKLGWEGVIRQDDFLSRLHVRLKSFVGLATMKYVWSAHTSAPGARALIDALIKHIIDTGDLGTIPLLEIVSEPNKYLYVVPWRLRPRFIALLETYNTFWTRLAEAPLNDGLAEAAKLISRKGDEQSTKVRNLLKTRLEQVTAADWKSAIESGAQPLMMASEFFPDGQLGLGARSELFQALSASIDDLLNSTDRTFRMRWLGTASHLSTRAEKDLYDKIATSILSGAKVDNLNFLMKLGGEKLFKSRSIAGRPDDAVNHILTRQMRTKDGRAWLRDRVEEVRPWIAKSKSQTKQQLTIALKAFETGKDQERKYWAEVVRKNWKLK